MKTTTPSPAPSIDELGQQAKAEAPPVGSYPRIPGKTELTRQSIKESPAPSGEREDIDKSLSEFTDFIDAPPQYEELRMVRDYRHELMRKWEPLFRKLKAQTTALSQAEKALEQMTRERDGWHDVVVGVAGLFGFAEPLKDSGYDEAECASGGLAHNFQMAVDELKGEVQKARAEGAVLLEALKPFAEIWNSPGTSLAEIFRTITTQQVRAAFNAANSSAPLAAEWVAEHEKMRKALEALASGNVPVGVQNFARDSLVVGGKGNG